MTSHMPLFEVFREGRKYGPMTQDELDEWCKEPIHFRFDLTQNAFLVDWELNGNVLTKYMNGLRAKEIQVLEHAVAGAPRIISVKLFDRLEITFQDSKDLNTCVRKIRNSLSKVGLPKDMIQTVRNISPRISLSRNGFRCDPDYTWELISLAAKS